MACFNGEKRILRLVKRGGKRKGKERKGKERKKKNQK
jgi:hypothetical protein